VANCTGNCGDFIGLAFVVTVATGLVTDDEAAAAACSRAGVAGDVVTVGVSCSCSDFCGARNDNDESGGGESLLFSSSFDSIILLINNTNQ